VNWSEVLFGAALVVVLVLVSVSYGWRQLQQLRRLRGQQLPDEEMRWESRKAWRRLISSGLTFVMALLLVGLLAYYEPAAQRLADERDAFAPGEAPAWTEEQKAFLRTWGGLVIALLVVLFAVVMLAGVDLWATRQYARRQFRKLQADRRAMIERQAMRMRRERDGQG
jgi:hypothetical protein